MKKTLPFMVLALVMVPQLCADVLFHVPWGKGAGQIGYYNASSPNFDQPYCEGPGGVALGENGEIWISDQFNDRILVFSHDGKLQRAVTEMAGQKIVRPKGLWLDAGKELIVLSAQSSTLTRFDLKANTATTIGSAGKGTGSLRQPELFGISMNQVCVEDDWKSELVCFARNGGAATRRPWVLGGLGVDANGAMYTLEFRQGKYVLISTGTDNVKSDHWTLQAPQGESLASLTGPQLLGLDAQGNALVRFFRGKKMVVARYDKQGNASRVLGELPVETEKQAYTMTADGSLVALSFDASAAPKGTVDVVEIK